MKKKLYLLLFNPCVIIKNDYVKIGKIKKKFIIIRIILLILITILLGDNQTMEPIYGLY